MMMGIILVIQSIVLVERINKIKSFIQHVLREEVSEDKQFDLFFHSYIETALWSSTDDEDSNLDVNYDE